MVLTIFAIILLAGYTAWWNPSRLTNIDWAAMGIRFIGYLGSSLVQAAAFFGFAANRIRTLIPLPEGPFGAIRHRAEVSVATATLFAIYHLPNGPLMGLVFLVGLGWTWIYYQKPNLPLLVLSHAILGTILHRIVQLPMRVGAAYADPDIKILRNILPIIDEIVGGRF